MTTSRTPATSAAGPAGWSDRLCLPGPVEAHIAKLRTLRGLGVDQFAVHAMHDAGESTIEDVLPGEGTAGVPAQAPAPAAGSVPPRRAHPSARG